MVCVVLRVAADMGKFQDVKRVFGYVTDLDVLVNNAGISYIRASLRYVRGGLAECDAYQSGFLLLCLQACHSCNAETPQGGVLSIFPLSGAMWVLPWR